MYTSNSHKTRTIFRYTRIEMTSWGVYVPALAYPASLEFQTVVQNVYDAHLHVLCTECYATRNICTSPTLVFRLSQWENCMNSSRADSHVNCLKTFQVSGTHCLHPQGKWSLSLRMETECVSETSEVFKQLTRLSAREEFIQSPALVPFTFILTQYSAHFLFETIHANSLLYIHINIPLFINCGTYHEHCQGCPMV
jgi:hypothetical protein